MPRPQSIYERHTTSTIPPPEFRQRAHLVVDNETLIGIANVEHSLVEYDADLWRDMAIANNIQNPFTFTDDGEFLGERIVVPGKPLPEFL